MNICIVGYGNEDGTRSWTDVALLICNEIKKNGHNVSYYRWKGKINHRVINKIKFELGRKFYFACSLRDPGIYKWNASIFKKLLSKENANCYLFMGEHCLNGQITDNSNSYAYIDSALQPVTRQILGNKSGMNLFFSLYEKNDAKSLNSCKKIFTQNEWSRQYLINQYRINKEKIVNIGFGINVDYYDGEKNYNNHRMLIVLRKGLEKIKGLDILIDAFKIAKLKIRDLELDVVGTEFDKYEGINYYFNQPREITKRLFKIDSLYVMPARNESNGITYLEALANKMPIMGLNRFAFPEFSGNGKYGFIVKNESPQLLADAIISAFDNIALLKNMGENGQQFVRSKYNWNTVVENMVMNMDA